MDSIKILAFYLGCVSILSLIITIYDKIASKHFTKHRVKESHLLLLSFVGGSLAMLLTMMVIRHKTQKPKFMVTIPLMTVFHLVIIIVLYLKGIL